MTPRADSSSAAGASLPRRLPGDHRPTRKTNPEGWQAARNECGSPLVCSAEAEMSDHQREIYHSENGDRWLLCRDDDGRVFVLHKANLARGLLCLFRESRRARFWSPFRRKPIKRLPG